MVANLRWAAFAICCWSATASVAADPRVANLSEEDNTAGWSFPYEAPAEKINRVRNGVDVVLKKEHGTPVSTFIQALGPPDVVTDLHKGFDGLSPKEDGMLVQFRQYLSYRLVWYLKKSGPRAHVDDSWFAAYVENEGDGVVRVASNNFR